MIYTLKNSIRQELEVYECMIYCQWTGPIIGIRDPTPLDIISSRSTSRDI